GKLSSWRVVEDEPERVPLARPDHGYSMSHRGRRPAPRRQDRPVTGSEYIAVAVREQGGRPAGLRPWPLLHQQEFPSGVVGTGFVQVDDDLERKHQVAVEVTVQGVPVPGTVAEQDRSWPVLPSVMAHLEPFVERVRPRGGTAELGPPVA